MCDRHDFFDRKASMAYATGFCGSCLIFQRIQWCFGFEIASGRRVWSSARARSKAGIWKTKARTTKEKIRDGRFTRTSSLEGRSLMFDGQVLLCFFGNGIALDGLNDINDRLLGQSAISGRTS